MFDIDKKWYVFALIIALSVLVFILSCNTPGANNMVEDAKYTGIGKVQTASAGASSGFKNFFYNLFHVNQIAKENTELVKENAVLENKINDLKRYKEENNYLKKLLDIGNDKIKGKVAVKVIGRSPNLWFDFVEIDKGASSGIKEDALAVSPGGLAGKVFSVYKSHSKVRLITSPKFVAACKVLKTGDTGLVYGYKGKECIVKYIDSSAKIDIGDLVVTSGMNGAPQDIPVGTVKKVIGSEDYMYKELILKPSVSLNKIDYLYIVK
ncbi:MAG: rod shape-determining protein MreC [Armatimonadota bacterium]